VWKRRKSYEVSTSHDCEYADNSFMEIASCSLGEVERRFSGVYCLYRQGDKTLMMDAARTSETSVYFNESTQCYISESCHIEGKS
jgi:hypothetical protein